VKDVRQNDFIAEPKMQMDMAYQLPISRFTTPLRCVTRPHRKYFCRRRTSITSSKVYCRFVPWSRSRAFWQAARRTHLQDALVHIAVGLDVIAAESATVCGFARASRVSFPSFLGW